MQAKNWAICTGSSPAIPPIEGLNNTPHITNREIFSLDALPKSMIVLGAGMIGIEMSQAFTRLGTKVTVIDFSDQILNKEDKDMADEVMNVMGSEGVTFYLKYSILSTKDLGNGREVTIKTGDGKTISLEGDFIFQLF